MCCAGRVPPKYSDHSRVQYSLKEMTLATFISYAHHFTESSAAARYSVTNYPIKSHKHMQRTEGEHTGTGSCAGLSASSSPSGGGLKPSAPGACRAITITITATLSFPQHSLIRHFFTEYRSAAQEKEK